MKIDYKQEARWYTALAYLNMNDIELCNNILKTINTDDEYYEEAQKLLDELN